MIKFPYWINIMNFFTIVSEFPRVANNVSGTLIGEFNQCPGAIIIQLKISITMLIARTSRVRLPQRGGTRLTRCAPSPPSASTTAAIFAGVGGTNGKPSGG